MTDTPDKQPGENETGSGFQLTVLWVLVAAFLLALPMMFVHPGFVIASVWLGLIVLGAAVAIWKLTGKMHLHH